MILGCGIDMVKVERFSKLSTDNKFIERFFHPEEIAYSIENSVNSSEILAARFAAKEALGKALGTGIGSLTLKNICVKKTENGKPCLHVFDDVKDALHVMGVENIHISLSHEKDYAIAQVILEKN